MVRGGRGRLQVGGALDARAGRRRRVGPLERPRPDRALEAPVDALQPSLQGRVVRLDDRHLEPGLRHDLGDAGSHGTAPAHHHHALDWDDRLPVRDQ